MKENVYERIDELVKVSGNERTNLLGILHGIQDSVIENYIPEEAVNYLSKIMHIPVSEIYEVITFYSALSEKPKGRYVVKVCDSTVCRLNHNKTLISTLESKIGVSMGETTEDKQITLEYSPCFGACDMSPAIRINEKTYGNLNSDIIDDILSHIRRNTL